ncbi:MAG TPA: 50S ribosomal protein L32 [Candidatus Paceibacterota bacterium]|nr:50S ribosomal protein L32 [Candidatus Paceibacterota bacterium]
MGGVPVKHHSKSKVGRRRSQLALKKRRLVVCSNCKGPTLPHRACPQCGAYAKSERSNVNVEKVRPPKN